MEWLENAIVVGIQSMVAIRMRNAPQLTTIGSVARIWMMVFKKQNIAWTEQEDAWRIEEAFLTHIGRSEEFATPKNILEAMPKRKEVALLALPKPECVPMPKNIRAEMNRIFRMSPEETRLEAEKARQKIESQKKTSGELK